MIRPVNPDKHGYVKWIAGAAINKGQLLVLSSTSAAPATESITTTIILGVAVEDCASGSIVTMYHPDQEFEFDLYQGSTVDEVTDAMVGIAYDIYVDGAVDDGSAEGEMYLDLNDTSTGSIFVNEYDNTRRVATGRFLRSLLYI